MDNIIINGVHWDGHRPVVGPKIVRNVPRPPANLVERYRDYFIPDISDRVGQLFTMDSYIHALYHPCKRLVGVALTVRIPRADNSSIHRAFNMVQPGDVLIVDARGDTEACGSGAGSLLPPISKGLAGVVIDGAWRDITELQAIDFPIYGKAISAFSPPKGRPGDINVPVCCGGVIVHPGDIVVCDQEGGVVIPREYAEIVANSLNKYNPRKSMKDWDLERIQKNAAERDKYFEDVFKMRGGKYQDWSEA